MCYGWLFIIYNTVVDPYEVYDEGELGRAASL